MRRLFTMRDALANPDIFGEILPGETWAAWRVILIAAEGEPLLETELPIYRKLTGREYPPADPCDEVWGVVGRRGGKTRAFAVAGAYHAACFDYDGAFAPGQRGRLPVMAASKEQAGEAYRYLLGIFERVPMFAKMLDAEPTQDTIRLNNAVDIVVTTANFRTVRGFTLVAAICDEIAFWHIENAANPDREILRATRPGLATTSGPLFVMSSPYAKRGELYDNHKRHFGPKGDPRILVVQAPTLLMHRTAKIEREVARAYENDAESARAEYGAEFREGISDFVSVEVVEACTDTGIENREPVPGVRYSAFVDPAGGSGQDSMTMAIAHTDEKGIGILDAVFEAKPPFSPEYTCTAFADALKRYRINTVTGDNYANEWPKEMFRKQGISYKMSEQPKGAIYASFLPLLNSCRVRLLDVEPMRKQLLGLERRTQWGGRDSIDHKANSHDDLINAAAGALTNTANPKQSYNLAAFTGEAAGYWGPGTGTARDKPR